MKICQIGHVIFQTTSQLYFKFSITLLLSCHEIYLFCTFLAQTLYTLVKSSPLKCNLLRLSSSRVKIRRILYVNSETTSQFLFRFFIMLQCHYLQFLCKLQLMHFLLWSKDSHENTNFDTFKCSAENLSNPSCHFPDHKSVFLQIFHDSSVSWNITPLYFSRSNVVYFAQKGPVKVQIFQTF